MAIAEERAAYVALALTPGIGPARLEALLAHCHSPFGALSAPFAFLCTVPGISRAAATAIKETSPAAGEEALAKVAALNARCLLPDDPEWPAALREISDAPTLLFVVGDTKLLELPAVAIVGSRDHSAYGAEVCHRMATAAAEAGVAVVSGMARGLDAIAHGAALDAGGPTIGVLGNGLGVIYPAANRALYQRVSDAGLLLTEFPPGERPGIGAFPRRNRLISGLARVTVVVEAADASGTLITVGSALAQGRDVMAVPGNITSATSIGTNRLIRDGAEPLLEAADLLAHYPEAMKGKTARPVQLESPTLVEPPGLSAPEQLLWSRLRDGPKRLDDLIPSLGAPVGEVLAALSRLELRGLATQECGIVTVSSKQ